MGLHDEYDQLEFRDGRLVSSDDEEPQSELLDTDPVVPDRETGFTVEIKPGALEANDAVVDVHEAHGEQLSFGSRADAEAFADRLSDAEGSIDVQAAARNDPSDVEGYLIAQYDRSVRDPASIDADTWTFDVGANLYGALGEAVVTSGAKPPALEYFVRQDLDTVLDARDCGLRISVTGGDPVSLEQGQLSWLPDCCIEARAGPGGELLERYWCEVKTGDASFERSQAAAMQALAAEERVLQIRVRIDSLPDQYSVRVTEVEPADD